jgi:hypothetical protein
MIWQQIYDPLGSIGLSALLASVPVVVMLAASAVLVAQILTGAPIVWAPLPTPELP